jgi:hypothetical protein
MVHQVVRAARLHADGAQQTGRRCSAVRAVAAPEHQEPVAGLPYATTSPGATSSGHEHVDALVGARVDIYLRAHPEYWRRLGAQVVWVDIAQLSTERGCLHHRRTVVYARWSIPVTRS